MEIQFVPALLHKEEIKRLYKTAFPKEERGPLFLLHRKAKKGKAKFSAVMDGEKFVGLTFIAGKGDVVTLMFLAVADKERGKGYGGRILECVRERYKGKRLFLNIEVVDPQAENYEQRRSRKVFYERNGFEGLDYRVREAGVPYEMLAVGGYVTKEEYESVMEQIFGKILYRFIKRM